MEEYYNPITKQMCTGYNPVTAYASARFHGKNELAEWIAKHQLDFNSLNRANIRLRELRESDTPESRRCARFLMRDGHR